MACAVTIPLFRSFGRRGEKEQLRLFFFGVGIRNRGHPDLPADRQVKEGACYVQAIRCSRCFMSIRDTAIEHCKMSPAVDMTLISFTHRWSTFAMLILIVSDL